MNSTFTIEKLPNEPVIIVRMTSQYSPAHDMAKSDAEARIMLDASDQPLFCIADIRQVSFTFEDILFAASEGARGKEPLWHHLMLRKMLFVSPSKAVKVAAQGLNTPIFGNLDLKVFDTVEEALHYCQSQAVI